MSKTNTKYTEQHILNAGFDEKYEQQTVEMLVENEAGDALVRQKRIGDYTGRIYSAGGYYYIADALPGSDTSVSVWRMSRIDSSGNELFADGDSDFDNVADDYLTISYT